MFIITNIIYVVFLQRTKKLCGNIREKTFSNKV